MHSVVLRAGEVPALETERLRLRAHALEDLEACCAMWADPVVTRYIGGKPFPREEVWGRIQRYAGHWSLLGFGYWVAEEKDSGEFVGELGFADMKRNIEPPLDDIPELGWALATRWHGKGYATEAVRAVIGWGDRHFGPVKTACLIHPENVASMRVAEKCGYREWRRTQYRGHETVLFARTPVL
jgi:RimJ/RimL family protein N-acetyltransferase